MTKKTKTAREQVEEMCARRQRLIEQLLKIKSDRDNGVISQEEFDTLYHPVREELDIVEDIMGGWMDGRRFTRQDD